MTLKEMIDTLHAVAYEKVEIRDEEGNEILTCPTITQGWTPYQNCNVIEWFPHGAPNKNATFTVYVKE